MSLRVLLFLLAAALSVMPARAHEVRPALLQLQEVEPGIFDHLWRAPVRAGRPLEISPVFPADCRLSGMPLLSQSGVYAEKRAILICDNGLRDTTISIEGLSTLRTDVLIRVDFLDGGSETLRATADAPTVFVSGPKSLWQVSAAYLRLGLDHILFGLDHLLFVAALVMLVDGWRRLLATVTAFTLAHSLTLAGATFGILSMPPRLTEALIALSIVFIAAEVIHRNRGEATLAIRMPWLIAFAFGLLHGLGFAGALREIGLPDNAVPAALLFFNVGVELGQLVFVAVVLVAVSGLSRAISFRTPQWTSAMAMMTGVIAGFWTVERVAAIWV